MKKSILRFSFIIFMFVLVFAFCGCDLFGGSNDIPNEEGKNITDDNFFNLDNLNCSNTDGTKTKVFTIYDDIDFDTIIYDSVEIRIDTVVYEIRYGGELQQTMWRGFKNKFGTYRLNKKGEYTIDVVAQRNNTTKLSGSFTINVVANGRPDSVQFDIRNSNGELVEKVKGGDNYTFTAKILSDGKEVSVPKENYYWSKPANAGNSVFSYSIDNTVREQVKNFDFICFVSNNMGEKINIVDQTFTEVDNLLKCEQFPEGIYYQYGFDISSKAVELDVNAANTVLGDYFYNQITAEYRFDNGQVMALEKTEKAEEGKFSLYITYDNSSYNVYSTRHYDYSTDSSGNKIANYYANGVMYQFDPNKRAAKMHLVVWQKVKMEFGYNYAAVKVDSSELDVAIKVNEITQVSVSSVSGASKNDSFPSLDPENIAPNQKYKNFTKAVVNDTVVLNVCCDMDNNGDNTNEFYKITLSEIKQYFVLNVNIDSDSLRDYTIDYSYQGRTSPIQHMKYENPALGIFDRYFVCPNTGTAQINVRSKFGGLVYSFTVNVIDKVFDEARKIQYDGSYTYNVFTKVDMRLFIQIKEIRLSSYSEKKYYLRNLREDEELEYLKNDETEVTAPDAFSSDDNRNDGQEIVVRIKNTAIDYPILRVYIIPSFEFIINDTTFSTANIDGRRMFVSTQKPQHTKEANPESRYFQGYMQVMDYEAAQDEVINCNSFKFVDVGEEKIISSYGVEHKRYSYTFDNGIFHIYYFFSHGIGAAKNLYRVEIAKIIVK